MTDYQSKIYNTDAIYHNLKTNFKIFHHEDLI